MKTLELNQMEEFSGGNDSAIQCGIGLASSALAIAGLFAAGPIGWAGIGMLLSVGATMPTCSDAGLW